MTDRWSDHFTVLSTRQVGANGGWKTTKADEITWQGYFEGRLLLIVTTVRLTGSNLAHFCVNSGARIGSHDWNLKGGHPVDLRVITRHPLSPAALQRLGELARTEDNRDLAVRQGKEVLAQAIRIS